MSRRSQTHPKKASIPLRRPRLLGFIALAMWTAAVAVSGASAIYAYDRVKALIFVAGLVMMDLAAAIVVSLMWFSARHYLQPLNENQIEIEYAYRAGHRDATLRFLQPGPGLQLVRPSVPIPAGHVPPQMPRGKSAAAAHSRARGQAG